MKNTGLFRVITFYIIALTVSNVFRFDLFHLQNVIDKLPIWAMLIYSPVQAIGVLIGALIGFKLLRKNVKTEISVWGTSKKWSIIMMLLPPLLLFILGVTNNKGVDFHYYGMIAGISTLIYCFFEEFGWRGYLESELAGISEFKRILIIAGLWYFWHLNFLRNPDLIQNIIFIVWLVLGSWGLGKIIKITKSIVAASSFHMLFNIVLFNGFIKDGLNSTDKIIILGVLIPIWVLILIRWKKENNKQTTY